MIRDAKNEDVSQLVELGELMHAESDFAFLPYDRAKVRRLIAAYIEGAEMRCGLVAESEGCIVGMLGGYLTDYFFCDELIACDEILFVKRESRGSAAALRLVQAFREWARERGAREVCLGTSTGIHPERTGRFYERLGLRCVGGLYKQRLS